MRIAILSDVHANVLALQAVLDDASRRDVQVFLNLGDSLSGPLWPNETYDLLQRIGATTVAGNNDRELCEAVGKEVPGETTTGFVLKELSGQAIGWLRSLPSTAVAADRVFLCHGTPAHDTGYLLEDVSRGFPVIRAEDAILRLLGSTRFRLVVCGHSHIPRIVQLVNGTMIINPGSVGLPAYDDTVPVYHRMEAGSPLASYAIATLRDEAWRAEVIAVPYNHRLAAEQARSAGRHDWAAWLATGRVERIANAEASHAVRSPWIPHTVAP